jgi:hypothetical protein
VSEFLSKRVDTEAKGIVDEKWEGIQEYLAKRNGKVNHRYKRF